MTAPSEHDEPVTPDTEQPEQEPTEQQEQEEATEETDPRLSKARNEAQRLRTRLRDAENERDGLAATVDRYQRAEISRQAEGPGKLHSGDDLLNSVTVADLVDDAGEIDTDAVQAAVDQLRHDKPHYGAPAAPASKPQQVMYGPSADTTPESGSSWTTLLRGDR